MEKKFVNEIKISSVDKSIDRIIQEAGHDKDDCRHTVHYTQSEDLFVSFQDPIRISHIPIHHDIHSAIPTPMYLSNIKQCIKSIGSLFPSFFEGMTYFFIPGEVLKPAFFQLFKIQEEHYLYILQTDFSFRPQYNKLIKQGDNDFTPEYETNHLFLDATIIPLASVNLINNKIHSFSVREIISQTWIGETGRGYLLQGIWMDNELTKFFSKLFIAQGKKLYPYYPFICKYKTVCHSVIQFSQANRRKGLPILHASLNFLSEKMGQIQNELKDQNFSESLEIYQKIKAAIPPTWLKYWENICVSAYLNKDDMKEYCVDFID